MRKAPQYDSTLYDHIKEIWKAWVLGKDDLLVHIHDFGQFLAGYFACYYKSDPTPIESALEYFSKKVAEWEREDDPVEDVYDIESDPEFD